MNALPLHASGGGLRALAAVAIAVAAVLVAPLAAASGQAGPPAQSGPAGLLPGARAVAAPAPGPAPAPGASGASRTARPAGIDVNIASADELQTVRGIGPSIAARIIEERARGRFRDLADLEARVKGIGPASVRRFVESGLVVGGANGKVVAGREPAAGGGTASSGAGAAPAPPEPPTGTTTPLGGGLIREYRTPAPAGSR